MYSIRRALWDDAPTLSALATRTFTETFGHLYPPQDLQAFLEEAYTVERQRVILPTRLRGGGCWNWMGRRSAMPPPALWPAVRM
jgi:hypothetical protein